MRRLPLIALLLIFPALLFGQGLKQEDVRSDVRLAARWFSGHSYGAPAAAPKAPAGFKPFNISTYARHGARLYSKESLYDQMHSLMTEADASGLLTPLGKELLSRSEAVYHRVRGRAYDLTELGQRQHREVADRIWKAWRPVFRHRRTIDARSTQTNRTILSMAAALDEYRRLDPRLHIRFDASAADMGVLNPTSKYNPRAEERDWSRAFEADTARWNPAFQKLWDENLDVGSFFGRFFTDPSVVLKTFKTYVNAARMFYFYLSFSETLGEDESLMYLMDPDDAWKAWVCENFRMYSCCGATPLYHGRNWALEEALLRDFLKYWEADMEGDVAARLRFGHDYKISGTLVLLDAIGWNQTTGDPRKVREIYDFGRMPMASTLLFTLYRGRSGEVLIRCTLDEEPVEFPIPCYTDAKGRAYAAFYRWTDFKAHCESRLALADKILETT